jgi:hypothetical protein
MPAGLAAIALLAAPLPALAHGGDKDDCCQAGPAAKGGMDDCCKADDKNKDKDACCADEGKGKGGDKGEACEDCDEMGHGEMGMHGHGMKGHGMMGHRGWMMGKRFSFNHELRYMPVMGSATNQWLVLGHGPSVQVNDWFSMGWQNNLAIQTFNNGPAGFWVAPYMGVLPKLGYSVGQARLDVGSLVGFGGMARTANVGGTADVLQARLMWAVEPRVELTWQGDGGMSWGLVGTYLLSQYQADLGGFSFGIKAGWGPKGHHGMGGGMGHDHDMGHDHH